MKPREATAKQSFFLATRNQHKVREMAELLPGVDLRPLPDEIASPPETGDSFEANALIKARAAHAATGEATSPTTRGSKPPTSAAPRGSTRPAMPARAPATRPTWRSCCAKSTPPAAIAAPPTSARSP